MFTRADYFENLGFKVDPFASTNSEHEEFLNDYFIDPPYFASLVGDLKRPKSSIIIAPRGFGKTAQRKRIEKLTEEFGAGVISILYDNFPIEGVTKTSQVSFEDHLARIIKSLLIAFLSQMYLDDKDMVMDEYERKKFLGLINKYLTNVTPMEITNALNSIKGIRGRLFDIWSMASKPISSIINIILKKKGLGTVDLTFKNKQEYFKQQPSIEDIRFIENLFKDIGVLSVYILIDKIDENKLTGNDSRASYELIKPLIKDLNLLENRIIVFKFFIWDKLTEYWSEDIRLDRIENYNLMWRKEQIVDMINTRLSVLSNNRITSLQDILDCKSDNIDKILIFAQNSPRDLINILKNIFDYHINRVRNMDSLPNNEDVSNGINEFCKNKFTEIVPEISQQMRLKRIKLTTFTISLLSNEIFKESNNKIRNMIMPWTRSGIISTLTNRVNVPSSKLPVNLYTVNDLRVARVICQNQKLDDFINDNILKCSECNSILVFDIKNTYGLKEFNCQYCQNQIIF